MYLSYIDIYIYSNERYMSYMIDTHIYIYMIDTHIYIYHIYIVSMICVSIIYIDIYIYIVMKDTYRI